MSNAVLGRELLRIHKGTAHREAEMMVRSSMRSQYEPGDNRSALIRSGVLDVIGDQGFGSYSGFGAVVSTASINAELSRNPAIRRAVDLLPPPFTAAQKTRIKREPLTFLEEYVQANKNLVVAIVRRARSKRSYPKAVSIVDPIARKRHTYKVNVTESSPWMQVLVAAIAMANRHPAEMALAAGETMANMTAQGVQNIVSNITSMFNGLGEAATATAAGGTAATITAITGLITAVAAAAGTILPILVGAVGPSGTAPVTQAERDSRPPAKKARTQRTPSSTPAPPTPVVAQPSSSKKWVVAGGALVGLGLVAALTRKK